MPGRNWRTLFDWKLYATLERLLNVFFFFFLPFLFCFLFFVFVFLFLFCFVTILFQIQSNLRFCLISFYLILIFPRSRGARGTCGLWWVSAVRKVDRIIAEGYGFLKGHAFFYICIIFFQELIVDVRKDNQIFRVFVFFDRHMKRRRKKPDGEKRRRWNVGIELASAT